MASNRVDYILRYGNHPPDEEFAKVFFQATDAEPGSREKVEVLARRRAFGQPLWHENDRTDYNGFGLLKLAERILKERECD